MNPLLASAPIRSSMISNQNHWYDNLSPGRQTGDLEMNLGNIMNSTQAVTA